MIKFKMAMLGYDSVNFRIEFAIATGRLEDRSDEVDKDTEEEDIRYKLEELNAQKCPYY